MSAAEGVSLVVPVLDGLPHLEALWAGIERQRDGRPLEVIVVDDGSTDGSLAWLEARAQEGRLRLLSGEGRGAAAAINLGIRHARHALIGQVDQDVECGPGWLKSLCRTLDAHPRAAAAQGHYTFRRVDPPLARVMGADLELRYQRLHHGWTNHVCTGNTLYRKAALLSVGLLDESLGYGYDNDLSYRLGAAGYQLLHVSAAKSLHRWRTGLGAYWAQQYGVGFGRLDVIARHPRRVGGDRVSGVGMILHAGLTVLALAIIGLHLGWVALGGHSWLASGAAAIFGALSVERAIAGARAYRRFSDWAMWLFPLVHLVRDLAWAWAAFRWGWARLRRRPTTPHHSMPRPLSSSPDHR